MINLNKFILINIFINYLSYALKIFKKTYKCLIDKQFFYSEDLLETRYYLELQSHENIVKFIDYFFDDNICGSKFYMVFEYCEVNIKLL